MRGQFSRADPCSSFLAAVSSRSRHKIVKNLLTQDRTAATGLLLPLAGRPIGPLGEASWSPVVRVSDDWHKSLNGNPRHDGHWLVARLVNDDLAECPPRVLVPPPLDDEPLGWRVLPTARGGYPDPSGAGWASVLLVPLAFAHQTIIEHVSEMVGSARYSGSPQRRSLESCGGRLVR